MGKVEWTFQEKIKFLIVSKILVILIKGIKMSNQNETFVILSLLLPLGGSCQQLLWQSSSFLSGFAFCSWVGCSDVKVTDISRNNAESISSTGLKKPKIFFWPSTHIYFQSSSWYYSWKLHSNSWESALTRCQNSDKVCTFTLSLGAFSKSSSFLWVWQLRRG